jgi:hypothetical protein
VSKLLSTSEAISLFVPDVSSVALGLALDDLIPFAAGWICRGKRKKTKRRRLGTLHPETRRKFKGISKELGLLEDHACGAIDPEDCSLSPIESGKADPLQCPRCQGRMRILAFIEDP